MHDIVVCYLKTITTRNNKNLKQATVPFGIRLSNELYQTIENSRGAETRNKFLTNLIESHFKIGVSK